LLIIKNEDNNHRKTRRLNRFQMKIMIEFNLILRLIESLASIYWKWNILA